MWVWINTYENTIFRGLFTSILTQLFWCSPGVQGFDTLPWPRWSQVVSIPPLLAGSSKGRSLKCWALAAWPLGPRSWYRDFTWFKHEKTGEVTGIWMRYHGKYMKYIHMCIYESYIYIWPAISNVHVTPTKFYGSKYVLSPRVRRWFS
jgi:hypothetical protein